MKATLSIIIFSLILNINAYAGNIIPTDYATEDTLNQIVPSKTAFGELLVGEITPKVQIGFPYNINTAFVNTSTVGSGTVTQSNSKAVLQTMAASSSEAYLWSRRVLTYRQGQGSVVRDTTIYTACIDGSHQIIGVGDAVDGFFFGCNGDTFGVLRRQNNVDNWTAQTSWSADKAVGAETLPFIDITKGNVYQIRYQWLGFGAITFWIEQPSTGRFIKVHTIEYANAFTDPSIFNPSLPLHAEVVNTTNDTNIMLQTSSMMGGIEGKEVDLGNIESISNSKASVTTTETNIITIQNKSLFVTKTNRVEIVLKAISYGVDGTKPAIVRLVKNTTLGGSPSYNDIDANTSVVSYDVAGTTLSGGEIILSIATNKSDGDTLDLSSYNIVLEPGETLTVSAEASSSTTDASVSLIWSEKF
jgi:hypothetical protein